MSTKPTGVMLLAFGGADSLEAVEPFMKNLMGGRIPPPPLVEKMKARYQLIGGKSPLPEITAKQAAKLEELLNLKGGNYKVVVGMRHWHPFISEALDKLTAYGVGKIIGLSMAPFYSQVSSGTYEEELKRAAASLDNPPEVVFTEPFYNSALFIEALAQRISETIADVPGNKRENIPVIFSAHSLPMTCIEQGDPYVKQLEQTVQLVANELGLGNWFIAYQSKGGGQGQWLGPTVEEVMQELKDKGSTDVIVVPVGFVSDHIETLYDIDIAQKKFAESLGLGFYRTAALNASDLFIQALAEIVQSK